MSMCLTKRTRKHKQIFDCSIPSHVPSWCSSHLRRWVQPKSMTKKINRACSEPSRGWNRVSDIAPEGDKMAHRLVRNYYYTIRTAAATIVITSRFGSTQKKEKEIERKRERERSWEQLTCLSTLQKLNDNNCLQFLQSYTVVNNNTSHFTLSTTSLVATITSYLKHHITSATSLVTSRS